ncbi:hypothetical protein [Actinomadura sp. WAC 06369]|uniref:hypothetical protein n=1 Tax=Actinomadura sp. WAC 06369 TaxID=2203193 RepID=UPI001F2B220A|nr:hypothetical protein [Actinomadura sp. WAC 06369]
MITWTNAPERSAVPRQTGPAPGAGSAPAAGPAAPPVEPSPAEALAERIAERVLSCADVVALTAGPHGRVATYRPGAPFAGVAVRAGVVEVGIVARYGRPLPLVAEDVRGLVRPLCEGRAVDVLIGDLADAAS